ncbi:helix-turn-helix domain-containing protein [Clostridium sp. MSJ-8]|uniref:helix-turn-helix domain-containing protein n=1 Tax=Clostridium sp. MSJ-8 TaxID=2841510 RepID=UPI001C0ED351|nr:helix-turn-helix domain-containing protein [Clostridium sp. MSJ-8]MBU5486989.1 helix-turn-helix domain-containing protein [Clostridium sp. MSJ-8]
MRYYIGNKERIGLDFYCDIAINIVDKRKKLNLTQGELAKKSGINLNRLRNIENVKTRIKLIEIESIARVLDVTVNNLINAQLDTQVTDTLGNIRDCLYTICIGEEEKDIFKIYQEATSKRMALLKLEQKVNAIGSSLFSNARSRCIVELVGVPMTNQELKDKLPKYKEDLEAE